MLRRRVMEGSEQMIVKGSFTPDALTKNYTIQLPRSCSNIIIDKHDQAFPEGGYGVKVIRRLECLKGIDADGVILSSNTAGSVWNSIGYGSNQYVAFDGNEAIIQSPFYLPNEQYDYTAW